MTTTERSEDGRSVTIWEAMKPGWRTALKAAWVVVLAAALTPLWPWVAFGLLSINLLAYAAIAGAQSAAIESVRAVCSEFLERRA